MIHLVYVRDCVIVAIKLHSNTVHLRHFIVVPVDLFDKVVIQVTVHGFDWLVRRDHIVTTRVLNYFSALGHLVYWLNCGFAGL